MTALLDPDIAARLAKLCGLFGSAHHGERAAAAAKADELIRSRGLTWQQILLPARDATDGAIEEQIDFCLDHGAGIVTAWEWGFLNGIRDWPNSLTEKQLAKLHDLVAKVSARRAAV